jgi:hypothetical protein
MTRSIRFAVLVLALILLSCAGSLFGQQKGQWMPGQMGLNSGILASPGITYANLSLDYNSSRFNGPGGNALLTGNLVNIGSFNVYANENIFYFVPDYKFLGGNLGFMFAITPANGNLTADILPNLTTLTASGGGGGLADTWVQPFTLGWHLKRVDVLVADAVMAPTGRYTPGASNNVGTGYVGNHVQTGSTVYVTKNRATSVNLFTDWEVHGGRQGTVNTDKTPGQAFTDEWGLGQVLPLKKNFSQLLQVGVVGYDQWQVTANTGTVAVPVTNAIVNANIIPYYSVHAVGVETVYILPPKNITAFFKFYHEYAADSHFQGSTFAFGGTWTFKIPRPLPPKK